MNMMHIKAFSVVLASLALFFVVVAPATVCAVEWYTEPNESVQSDDLIAEDASNEDAEFSALELQEELLDDSTDSITSYAAIDSDGFMEQILKNHDTIIGLLIGLIGFLGIIAGIVLMFVFWGRFK